VQDRERFAKLKIVEVAVQDAIKNPAALFSRLAE
jgi:fructose-specific phosphotransferase system component IIB